MGDILTQVVIGIGALLALIIIVYIIARVGSLGVIKTIRDSQKKRGV